jgi:hypothetical protein
VDPRDLATAFAVWAAVVGMIGVAIVWELSRLRGEVKAMAELLNRHQMITQGRLTAVETHLHIRDGFIPSNHFGLGD